MKRLVCLSASALALAALAAPFGAAAHKAGVGHRLIICAYAHYSEAELANFKPHVLYMGADGDLSHTSNAIPVQVA